MGPLFLVVALLHGQASQPSGKDSPLVASALSLAAAGEDCTFEPRKAELWFDAKGRLACKTRVLPLPEGADLVACVRTTKGINDKYRVYVSFAKPSDEAPSVRGPTGGAALGPKQAAEAATDQKCTGTVRIASSEVTVHVETSGLDLPGGDVSAATALPVARRYNVNIGLLGAVAKRETTYGISSGQVTADRVDSPMRFYLTFHTYPLSSFSRFFGDGEKLYGNCWRDRMGLFAGVQIPDATKSLAFGISAELVPGLMVAAGWAPRRIVVPDGYAAGDAISQDKLPTITKWDRKSAVLGIAVDATLAKSVGAFVK